MEGDAVPEPHVDSPRAAANDLREDRPADSDGRKDFAQYIHGYPDEMCLITDYIWLVVRIKVNKMENRTSPRGPASTAGTAAH